MFSTKKLSIFYFLTDWQEKSFFLQLFIYNIVFYFIKHNTILATKYQDIHKNIIEQSKKGKSHAQYRLYQLYAKAMFNLCFRMLNQREEAEDMLQEVFVDAFSKLKSFRYESSFGAWLKRITVNKCINHIKKRRADLMLCDDLSAFEKYKDTGENKDSDLQLSVEKVHKALTLLPDGSRIIFSLYALEGYDHSEISQIMNISESTPKSQYLRAKRKLKEILDKSA